jgi:polysaccharide biosynthesis protein PslJ
VPAWLQATYLCIGALAIGLPSRWLPAASLGIWALLPIAYAPIPLEFARFGSPAVLLLIAWELRCLRLKASGRFGGVALGTVLLVLSLVMSTFLSVDPARSLVWSVTFAACVLGPLVVSMDDIRMALPPLLACWRVLAVVLGGFAIVERAFRVNPLAAHYYINGVLIGQRWSVYRVETTLGHPLMNSTFFCVTACLFLCLFFTRWKSVDLMAAALAVGGIWLSGSRSGLIAFAVGMSLWVLAFVFAKSGTLPRKAVVVAIGATAAVALLASGVSLERSGSQEGRLSSDYRTQVIDVSLRVAHDHPFFGSGAGTAQVQTLASGFNVIVENSALQILIALGWVGSLAVILFLAQLLIRQVVRGSFAGPAAATTLLIQLAGFNAVDSIPAVLVLLAITTVVGVGMIEPARHPSEREPARQRVRIRAQPATRSGGMALTASDGVSCPS